MHTHTYTINQTNAFYQTQPCIMARFALWTEDSVNIKSTSNISSEEHCQS